MSYMLVDLNQVLIANLLQNIKHVDSELNEDLVRHMSINTIRSNIKQFKSKYSEIVLCCDSKHYWRRDRFAFYKSHRKHDREASGLDWDMIFTVMNSIRDELRENFPYKVLNVDGAEADDVIAVLTARLAPHKPVLILSSDKDFGQLQKYPNVTQYSPILKRFIKIDNPAVFVREHIIKGDRGDGIPNILSNDNVFVIGERQKPVTSKKLTEWIQKDPTEFCTSETMLRCYHRNRLLIDFDYIPSEVQQSIVDAFESSKPATKQRMLDYFIAKGLKVMIENINDF